MKLIIIMLTWLIISVIAGAISAYFFQMNFWLSTAIVGLALIANGLIADWEDRRQEPDL